MIRRFGLLILLLILLSCSSACYAWPRASYEDAVVIERSELIVVGHLKEGSIQYIPHDKAPTAGASWEHHATLVISEVMKGTSHDKEISIVIHYGLTPVVGGHIQ